MSNKALVKSDSEKIKSGLEIISQKLKNLEEINQKPMQTSCLFKWTPSQNSNSTDISKCQDVELMIHILAYIGNKKQMYQEKAEELGLSSFPVFNWLGFSYEAWENDIKIRIMVVNSKNEHDNLMLAKAKLERHISEEERRSNDILEAFNMLGINV